MTALRLAPAADELGLLSPELALVDPQLAARARAALRSSPASLVYPPPARAGVAAATPASAGPRPRRTTALVVAASVVAVLAVGRDVTEPRSPATLTPPLQFVVAASADDPGLTSGTLAALEVAVRRSPRSPLAREELGTAYLRLRRWREAERELRALVRLAPRDDYARFALGHALAGQGKKRAAARAFAAAESLAGG